MTTITPMTTMTTKKSEIDTFIILGERCSGTHFLKYAIQNNFEITNKRIKTHFFGFNDLDYTNGINGDIEKTLYICLVRHPIDWIDSLFKRLHHIPSQNKKNIESFISNEFYSIYEENNIDENIKIGDEIMEDRNIYNGQRYKNIFELRKVKNDYFLKMCDKVKYFMILKYEDLRDNYENTLDYISNYFNIKKKSPIYRTIIKYKGTYDQLYVIKKILLSNDVQKYITENVDTEQEEQIGYFITPTVKKN